MKIKILIGITLLNFGFTNYINAQSPKENIVINTDSTPHKTHPIPYRSQAGIL